MEIEQIQQRSLLLEPIKVEDSSDRQLTLEREKIAAISALGRTHNMQDLAGTAITEGRSLDVFKSAFSTT